MGLSKSSHDKMLLGVCSGLARHWGWDVTILRLGFVLATIFTIGSPILIYVILGIVMPND